MKVLDPKTLQRLFDEELGPAEEVEARAALEESAADQQRLASLEQLRTLVRVQVEDATGAADLDRLWSRVEARLGEERRPPLLERLRVWLGESMGAHPGHWIAAGAVAAAAAVVLAITLSSGAGAPPAQRAPIPVTNRLDIEGLEFRGRHPDIFRIKGKEDTTTVIWIYGDEDEEEPDEGGGDDPDSPEEI